MEEKKSKERVMNAGEEKRQKLTYDQLNDACSQLFQQNQQLVSRLRDAEMTNMFKRLDYLFKVVENKDTFMHYAEGSFFSSCVREIAEALTVKEEEKGE